MTDLVIEAMVWPPPLPPNGRQNATPELDSHPSDHNLTADALAALVARVNSSAWGIIPNGLQTITANISITGTGGAPTPVASVNVTTVANRRYLIELNSFVYSDTAANMVLQLGIYRDGSQINSRAAQMPVQNWGAVCYAATYDAPTAGAHTYSVTGYRSATNNLFMGASAIQPTYFSVRDIGPTAPI